MTKPSKKKEQKKIGFGSGRIQKPRNKTQESENRRYKDAF